MCMRPQFFIFSIHKILVQLEGLSALCLVDVIYLFKWLVESCPVYVQALASYDFCHYLFDNVDVASGMVNPFTWWYPWDLCSIWFSGSLWLTKVVKRDFTILIVSTQ